MARPKCLLPLLNEPLLAHLYRALASAGITDVTFVVRQADQPLVAGVPTSGLQVRWVLTDDSGGSGTAAMMGLRDIAEDETCLVVEGDVWVFAEDLTRLMDSLSDNDMAVLVDPLRGEMPQDWLVADVAGNQVRVAWGHPREGDWRISGAYVLTPTARQALARPRRRGVRVPVGGMPHQEYDVAEVINTVVDAGGKVGACRAQKPVMNWDKPWHIYQGNLWALQQWGASQQVDAAPDSVIDPTAQIRGPLRLGRGSRIGHGAIIDGPVIVGEQVVIDDYAKVSHAVVGNGSLISHTAEFLGGVIMENVYLMHNCELYGVLGHSVDIGAGTVCGTLRFDDRETPHRITGRWETPQHGSNATYLGDYSRTGVNVVILPGKHIGPYAVVGPGVVVNRDIEAYTEVLLEQQWTVRKWGPEQYGW
jgi:bifunctional UDP-N-acetylglucosamine pyrophosphorylase/glucosamine-1-phosphate N-acetyltransferase